MLDKFSSTLNSLLQFIKYNGKFIVEEGKIDNLWYTKYSDGTAELHGYIAQTVSFDNTETGMGGVSGLSIIKIPANIFSSVFSGSITARTTYQTEVRSVIFNPTQVSVTVACSNTGQRTCTFNINLWGNSKLEKVLGGAE